MISKLRSMDYIQRVDEVLGRFDLIVRVVVPSMEKLDQLLSGIMRRTSGISGTETLVVIGAEDEEGPTSKSIEQTVWSGVEKIEIHQSNASFNLPPSVLGSGGEAHFACMTLELIEPALEDMSNVTSWGEGSTEMLNSLKKAMTDSCDGLKLLVTEVSHGSGWRCAFPISTRQLLFGENPPEALKARIGGVLENARALSPIFCQSRNETSIQLPRFTKDLLELQQQRVDCTILWMGPVEVFEGQTGAGRPSTNLSPDFKSDPPADLEVEQISGSATLSGSKLIKLGGWPSGFRLDCGRFMLLKIELPTDGND